MAEKTDDQHTGGTGTLAQQLPTDRLKQESQSLLTALGEKALSSVSSIGEGGGLGGMVKPLMKAGLGKVKDKVMDKAKEAIPGLGGGGGKDKKLKVTNIVEQIDVGAAVSLTYNLWTQFEDFPSFMKKAEDVSQESETEMEWKAQSHRKWHSEILEQVPDKRII